MAEFRTIRSSEDGTTDPEPAREASRELDPELAADLVREIVAAHDSGQPDAARNRFERLTSREKAAVVGILSKTHGNGWIADVLGSERDKFLAREAAMREKTAGMTGYARALARHRGEGVEPSREETVAALEARDAEFRPEPTGAPLRETAPEPAAAPVEQAHDPDPIASGPSAESTFRERAALLEAKSSKMEFLERALARVKRKS